MSYVVQCSFVRRLLLIAVAIQFLTISVPGAERVSRLRVLRLPDLVPSGFVRLLSTNAVGAGETLEFEWSGQNIAVGRPGSGIAKPFSVAPGPWDDGVFLVNSTSSYFLGAARFTGRLKPGDMYRLHGAFTVPANIPPGAYVVEIRADYVPGNPGGAVVERNEVNNVVRSRTAVRILPPSEQLPDLFPFKHWFEFSTNAIVPLDFLHVRWAGLNNATGCPAVLGFDCVERFGPAIGTWEDSLYLVNDSTRRKLGSATFTGSVAVGGEYQLEGSFQIPLDLLPGQYNLELRLDDAPPGGAGNLLESNENNNVLVVTNALRVFLDPLRPF